MDCVCPRTLAASEGALQSERQHQQRGRRTRMTRTTTMVSTEVTAIQVMEAVATRLTTTCARSYKNYRKL